MWANSKKKKKRNTRESRWARLKSGFKRFIRGENFERGIFCRGTKGAFPRKRNTHVDRCPQWWGTLGLPPVTPTLARDLNPPSFVVGLDIDSKRWGINVRRILDDNPYPWFISVPRESILPTNCCLNTLYTISQIQLKGIESFLFPRHEKLSDTWREKDIRENINSFGFLERGSFRGISCLALCHRPCLILDLSSCIYTPFELNLG